MQFVLCKADDKTTHEAMIKTPFAREVVQRFKIFLCLCIGGADAEWLQFMALCSGLAVIDLMVIGGRTMFTHRCGCRGSAVAVDQKDRMGAYSALK